MQAATGTVVDGKVVVEGLDLAEGQVVTILTREPDEEVHLSLEEEAELLEAIAEADRGETISAEELSSGSNASADRGAQSAYHGAGKRMGSFVLLYRIINAKEN